jgi:hypothetical protein
MFHSWFALAYKTAQLGFEAQNVVALRLMRLAAGGTSSQTEARRMINEKFAALADAQITGTAAAMAGRPADVVSGRILNTYKKRVRANRRRLSGR